MNRFLFMLVGLMLLVAIPMTQFGCNREQDTVVPESSHWLELLDVIPANENTLMATYINDFAYLQDKMEQYPQLEYIYALSFGHPLIGARRYDEDEWEQTLTFTREDVEQSIYAGAVPITSITSFNYYEAVQSQFDEEELENAVRTGPLNDVLDVISYKGHEFYSWGEDGELFLSQRSILRPTGKGYRLVLLDDCLYWISWTEGIKEVIDCYENNIDSLADKDEYQSLAGALEELDTVNAFFSSESQSVSSVKEWHNQSPHSFDDEQNQRFLEATDGSVLLKPYKALATGAGFDEQGFYLAIVLLHSNDDLARDNVTLLESRINQFQSVWRGVQWTNLVESVEIQGKGKLTLAKLYGPIVEYWDSFDKWNGNYEPLLVSE